MAVDIHDGNGFEQSDENKSSRSCERVEYLDPIFTGTGYEQQTDQVTQHTHNG